MEPVESNEGWQPVINNTLIALVVILGILIVQGVVMLHRFFASDE